MTSEHSVEVAAPLEDVWRSLLDIELVARCLPGAELAGHDDDDHRATYSSPVDAGDPATLVATATQAGPDATRVHVALGSDAMSEQEATGLLAAFTGCLAQGLAVEDTPAPGVEDPTAGGPGITWAQAPAPDVVSEPDTTADEDEVALAADTAPEPERGPAPAEPDPDPEPDAALALAAAPDAPVGAVIESDDDESLLADDAAPAPDVTDVVGVEPPAAAEPEPEPPVRTGSIPPPGHPDPPPAPPPAPAERSGGLAALFRRLRSAASRGR